jgi:hypothetical protein
MFATQVRKLTDQEAKQLCERYVILHRYRMVRPNEALFVDLRPAFSIPLSNVNPKESFAVPKDCIPELCQVSMSGEEIINAAPLQVVSNFR